MGRWSAHTEIQAPCMYVYMYATLTSLPVCAEGGGVGGRGGGRGEGGGYYIRHIL